MIHKIPTEIVKINGIIGIPQIKMIQTMPTILNKINRSFGIIGIPKI